MTGEVRTRLDGVGVIRPTEGMTLVAKYGIPFGGEGTLLPLSFREELSRQLDGYLNRWYSVDHDKARGVLVYCICEDPSIEDAIIHPEDVQATLHLLSMAAQLRGGQDK
jgi:hypothetical protein